MRCLRSNSLLSDGIEILNFGLYFLILRCNYGCEEFR
jgi:hypothetical protein